MRYARTIALASCSLALILTACASQTCLHPLNNLKDQYLVSFPRKVVVRTGDPASAEERHMLYAERLNSHMATLSGAETCRAVDFAYYEGGGIGARVECQVRPPLAIRPGIYNKDGSSTYVACYSANR